MVDWEFKKREWYGILQFNVHSTQYRSFQSRGPWAVMYISHSVMEGQRHNNPLTRVAFVYNGPKGMELAPNPHYSGGS